MIVNDLLRPLLGVRQLSLLREQSFTRTPLATGIGTSGARHQWLRIAWCSCPSQGRRFRTSAYRLLFVHRRLAMPTE